MLIKDRAQQLWQERVSTAAENPMGFRKGIIDTLVAEFGCSVATASTQYNTVKKKNPEVPGLGRKRVERAPRAKDAEPDDEPCYSVLELEKVGNHLRVARSRSFILQGDASETYDIACQTYPNNIWVMIYGIGPVYGENYRLASGEHEIKRSR